MQISMIALQVRWDIHSQQPQDLLRYVRNSQKTVILRNSMKSMQGLINRR